MAWVIRETSPTTFELQAISDADLSTPVGSPIAFNKNDAMINITNVVEFRRISTTLPLQVIFEVSKIIDPTFSDNKDLYDKLKLICYS